MNDECKKQLRLGGADRSKMQGINFILLDDELEIHDQTQYCGDDDVSMFHCWMNSTKRMSFVIGEDCTLETHEDGYGGKIYSIVRAEEDNTTQTILTKEKKE